MNEIPTNFFGGEDSMMGWIRCEKCNQVKNREEEPRCHCGVANPKPTLKRFLLFHGENFYPSGGWHDFRGQGDTVEECLGKLALENECRDWWHIVDLETGRIVTSSI